MKKKFIMENKIDKITITKIEKLEKKYFNLENYTKTMKEKLEKKIDKEKMENYKEIKNLKSHIKNLEEKITFLKKEKLSKVLEWKTKIDVEIYSGKKKVEKMEEKIKNLEKNYDDKLKKILILWEREKSYLLKNFSDYKILKEKEMMGLKKEFFVIEKHIFELKKSSNFEKSTYFFDSGKNFDINKEIVKINKKKEDFIKKKNEIKNNYQKESEIIYDSSKIIESNFENTINNSDNFKITMDNIIFHDLQNNSISEEKKKYINIQNNIKKWKYKEISDSILKNDNTDEIKSFIEEKRDILNKIQDSNSLIYYGIISNNLDIVLFCIKNDVKFNRYDNLNNLVNIKHYQNILQFYKKKNKDEVFKFIFKYSFKYDLVDIFKDLLLKKKMDKKILSDNFHDVFEIINKNNLKTSKIL